MKVPHVMILASAGSGKTHALTNRYVQLLADGAQPDRIVALTFTRKAAGEFFDEILKKLAGAACNPDHATRLAIEIERTALKPRDFLRMLRAVCDLMHRLRLGTLDAFFAGVARLFPLELGLAGDFEILEDHASQIERHRVLRRMFARSGELAPAQRDFIEAFKRATFGLEEKQLGARLEGFLDAYQENLLSAPDEKLWGHPERIWPAGNAWISSRVDLVRAKKDLRSWLAAARLEERQRGRWEEFLAALDLWGPGMPPPREMAYVLEKVLADWSGFVAGNAVLEFDRRPQDLAPAACAAMADITRHVVGGELLRRLATTRGLHAVLSGYEASYHDAVRRAGKLTFGDVQRLLDPQNGAPMLTRGAAAEDRLFIDFRLDAEIDHWLLDEFQDTSFGQWSVLQNLIDEVVQDPEQRRTFFCVGDVKQAIFTWRDGDPGLFREIFDHYNAANPGTITARHLDESWRSGPPIIAMVNGVFGAAEKLSALFPGDASQAWNREWRNHVSAVPQRGGQAMLVLADDDEQRWDIALRIVKEIRPLERGLTCAMLVQSNRAALQLADYLRRHGGLPASAESEQRVCADNPLGAALLSLIKAAAHPADSFAWEHVQMTPMRDALVRSGITTPEALSERVLGQIHDLGFERTVEHWARAVSPHLDPDDKFTRQRERQFTSAAALFDKAGSRDPDEFLAYMCRQTARDGVPASAIRVMTIHKSKGLGFDVVVLPDLEGTKLDSRREGLAIQKKPDRSVEWVLDLPPRLFWQRDDVLAHHVCAAEAEACYEALSLLYVAMTRAKRGMYAIVKRAAASTSRNYPRLLTETLGAATTPGRIGGLSVAAGWASGDADWFAGMKPPEPTGSPGAESGRMPPPELTRASRRPAHRASAANRGTLNAGQVFSLERANSAEFGTSVHRLLAEVEWIEPSAIDARVNHWRRRSVDATALAEAEECLRSASLRGVWERPASCANAEVWVERAFESVLDGNWVSGVFDRVVVERDAEGAAVRVTVYDFKTDRPTAAVPAAIVARYATQLNTYRRVAAELARVPVSAVSCELVLTRTRARLIVPPAI